MSQSLSSRVRIKRTTKRKTEINLQKKFVIAGICSKEYFVVCQNLNVNIKMRAWSGNRGREKRNKLQFYTIKKKRKKKNHVELYFRINITFSSFVSSSFTVIFIPFLSFFMSYSNWYESERCSLRLFGHHHETFALCFDLNVFVYTSFV